MEPIISPWIPYIASVVDSIKGIFITVLVISLAIATITGIDYYVESPFGDKEARKKAKKMLKYSLIAAFVTVLPVIFIPTKETFLAMVTLNYITPDNIQVVQGNVVDFVNQIMEAINRVGK